MQNVFISGQPENANKDEKKSRGSTYKAKPSFSPH